MIMFLVGLYSNDNAGLFDHQLGKRLLALSESPLDESDEVELLEAAMNEECEGEDDEIDGQDLETLRALSLAD